jgi:hypothetical protein
MPRVVKWVAFDDGDKQNGGEDVLVLLDDQRNAVF